MPTVSEILDGVYLLVDIEADETVLAASWRMSSAQVGALLVMRHGEPVGILTERDLMVRVISKRREPAETLVVEVMSAPLLCVYPHTSLEACRELMASRCVRHLPVFHDDTPVAMISSRDLLKGELPALRRGVDRALVHTTHQLH